MFLCLHPETAPHSVTAAVDPATLEAIDWIEMPEMVGGCATLSIYHGHTYRYLVGRSKVYHYEWDTATKNLAPDAFWGSVP